MTTKIIKRVAFFGDADVNENDQAYILAKETSSLLAKNGYVIINGGGPGIMRAATLGARENKGRVELVVMDPKKEPDNYEGIDKENFAYAQTVYYANSYEERLNKLIEVADAYVIFKGGTGTLSEVGMVWEKAKFEFGHHEPLIFVGKEWEEIVRALEEKMKYQDIEKKAVTTVGTAEEVLKALKRVEN